MDDEIIYSWCFNCVDCFDSTPSAAIIVLEKILESFSSIRSQQLTQEMRCDEILGQGSENNKDDFFYTSILT